MPLTAEPLTDETTGTFAIGDGPSVRRLGFGAMRLTGDGIWHRTPASPTEPHVHLQEALLRQVIGRSG